MPFLTGSFLTSPFFFFFIFSISISLSPALSSIISDGVFNWVGLGLSCSGGRSLLQAKKNCPVNFEFQNYTIITSQCKGPQYSPSKCCAAFKEFACPFVVDLNDVSNDCASTMFSYINLYGKYPPGLFASECREGKLGLACNVTDPAAVGNANANGGQTHGTFFILIVTAASALFLLIV